MPRKKKGKGGGATTIGRLWEKKNQVGFDIGGEKEKKQKKSAQIWAVKEEKRKRDGSVSQIKGGGGGKNAGPTMRKVRRRAKAIGHPPSTGHYGGGKRKKEKDQLVHSKLWEQVGVGGGKEKRVDIAIISLSTSNAGGRKKKRNVAQLGEKGLSAAVFCHPIGEGKGKRLSHHPRKGNDYKKRKRKGE